MNNEIVLRNDMSFVDLQSIINQAMNLQNEQLRQQVKLLEEKQKTLDAKLDATTDENTALRELELKRHRVEEHRYGFVSLADLGQVYQVSIGSKYMGKLLRLAGIAKAKQSKTEPLRSSTLNNFSKSVMYGDFPTYQWNPEKCIAKIDRWLDKIGVIDQFYAIDDEAKLHKYIQELEQKYSE
jgi:hypothetical protein